MKFGTGELRDIFITEIAPEVTHDLRLRVLRANKPHQALVFSGDNHHLTFHLGAFIISHNEQLPMGVMSVVRQTFAFSCQGDKERQRKNFYWRIRGMAVEPSLRSCQVGSLLLARAISMVETQYKEAGFWCNARIKAVNFYKKNDFIIVGDPFEIKDIGIHYKMVHV